MPSEKHIKERIDYHVNSILSEIWSSHVRYIKTIYSIKVYRKNIDYYRKLEDRFFKDISKLFKTKNNYLYVSDDNIERICSIAKVSYGFDKNELYELRHYIKKYLTFMPNLRGFAESFTPCNHTILKIEKPKLLGANDMCEWCLKVYQHRLNKREGLKLSMKELEKLPRRRLKSLPYMQKIFKYESDITSDLVMLLKYKHYKYKITSQLPKNQRVSANVQPIDTEN